MHNPFAKHINLYAGHYVKPKEEEKKVPDAFLTRTPAAVSPMPRPALEKPKMPGLPAPIHGGGGAVLPKANKPKKGPPIYLPGEQLLKKMGGKRMPPKEPSSDEDEPEKADVDELDEKDVANIHGAILDIMVRMRR